MNSLVRCIHFSWTPFLVIFLQPFSVIPPKLQHSSGFEQLSTRRILLAQLGTGLNSTMNDITCVQSNEAQNSGESRVNSSLRILHLPQARPYRLIDSAAHKKSNHVSRSTSASIRSITCYGMYQIVSSDKDREESCSKE